VALSATPDPVLVYWRVLSAGEFEVPAVHIGAFGVTDEVFSSLNFPQEVREISDGICAWKVNAHGVWNYRSKKT
jgi:hypothetical protein